MPSNDVLYLLADYEKYRVGKINLLSAKSSVLISREKIKSLIELSEKSDVQKKKIKKEVTNLKNNIKSFIDSLPKSQAEAHIRTNKEIKDHKEINKEKKVEKKKSNIPDPKKTIERDEIKEELDAIQQKLSELGAE